MDVNEQVRKLQELIESKYHSKLLEIAREGKEFLVIDFPELSHFDPDLANYLLDFPEEVIKSAQIAVENVEVFPDSKNFNVRFNNLPDSQKVMIKDIRSKHLNKFLVVEGLVKQKSDVRPQVTLAKFECPGCGNIISVYQVDSSFKEPTKCSCGKRRSFKILDKELVDAQRIVMEESPEDIEGGEQPKRMSVMLKADLVSPLSEKKTNPGSKISVIGIVKEVPITLKTGAKSTTFDLFIDANYIEGREESFGDIKVTKEEEDEILAIAADERSYEKMVNSIAPSIYGHDKVKEALLLQLMGGVRKKREDGVITRGDIHVLLVGDPGAGKCLHGNTLVHLADGSKIKISELKNKDCDVLCLNENLEIVSAKKTGFYERNVKTLLEIRTDKGKEIKLTQSHPLLTLNGWIPAKKLKQGDKILVENDKRKKVTGKNNRSRQIQIILTDILLEEISEIKKLKGDFKVYDICIPQFRNFIANGVVVHNSQLLKRISNVAPKCRYVSGKGASAAGLCVAPDSLVMTNPGGMHEIKDIVEPEMNSSEEYSPGIWHSNDSKRSKIMTLDDDLKIKTQYIGKLWKLKAPEKMVRVTTRTGKSISLTPKTKLFSINSEGFNWKESDDLEKEDYIAVARNTNCESYKDPFVIDSIVSNPVVYGVKKNVKNLIEIISKKQGLTKREIAKKLDISEDNLYYNWVNEKARGNITLKDLKSILKETKKDLSFVASDIKELSLYKGHKIKIPVKFNSDLLYFAGIIAGDGDLSKGSNTVTIRFSNNDKELIEKFKSLAKNLFSVKCNKSSDKSSIRSESWRFSSMLTFEILSSLGIPKSPKSKKIDMSNLLLTLKKEDFSYFLRGLFDTDGSVIERVRGSSYVDFTTTSKNLGKKLHLALLKYGIISKIREKHGKPNSLVNSNSLKYIVEIKGKNNLLKFKECIGFESNSKKTKLERIISKISIDHTNVDIIPYAKNRLKLLVKKHKIKGLEFLRNPSGISRKKLAEIFRTVKVDDPIADTLNKLVNSDVFWDKIVKKEYFLPEYDYVYDLTVDDSHNFLVDGFVVHNTASVVRDEFLKGWSLEAGALALTNGGYCLIDELDKMTSEDRDAMHEALEQQSYHHDTEINLANGNKEKIGILVDSLIEKYKNQVISGKDCEILNKKIDLLTTDFKNIFPVKTVSVSRHKAPDNFIEINYSNGRKIKVTPEHPVFVFDNEIKTVSAQDVRVGMLVPAPKNLPFKNKNNNCIIFIKIKKIKIVKNKDQKWVYDVHVEPTHNFISEGLILHNSISISKANIQACYSEDTEVLTNKGWKKYFEVKNEKIAQYDPKNKTIKFLDHKGLHIYDYKGLMYNFKNKRNDILVTPNHRMLAREYSQKEFKAIEAGNLNYNYIKFVNSGKYESKESDYFILPAIKHKQKRIHPKYTNQEKPKKIPMNLWLEFLGYFLTEGGLQKRACFGIPQKIGKKSDKIKKCLQRLSKIVGFKLTENLEKGIYKRFQVTNTQLFDYLEKNCGKNFQEKKFPYELSVFSKKQLKILYDSLMLGDGSSDGKYFSSGSKELIDIFHAIACLTGKSASQHIHYQENYRGKRVRMYRVSLSDRISPSIRKKSIKKIEYDGKVYCFATETGFFITRRNGKIAIQGNTLRAETTVLAAANPKFGRFAPYDPIAKQIDLPPTLISRFDLIFPIKDLPNEARDTSMAEFILKLHQNKEAAQGEYKTRTIKTFISYARQQIAPILTEEALTEIRDYYVKMRGMGKVEGEVVTIPITARQLEALVRLSEASAKTRLSKKVTKADASRAIELLDYCLRLIGMDKETGTLDIDRISIGIGASQRNKIHVVRNIIEQLEESTGKEISMKDVVERCREKNISADEVEEIVEKLKRLGDIYEPTRGRISRVL